MRREKALAALAMKGEPGSKNPITLPIGFHRQRVKVVESEVSHLPFPCSVSLATRLASVPKRQQQIRILRQVDALQKLRSRQAIQIRRERVSVESPHGLGGRSFDVSAEVEPFPTVFGRIKLHHAFRVDGKPFGVVDAG